MNLRPLTTYEAKILNFMADREYTRGHADRVNALECMWDEVYAEAGRYGQFCQFTQAKLRQIEEDREEEIHDAVERYEDWATD